METMKAPRLPSRAETTKNLISSRSEVIGSFIGMGIVGFCFGIGLMRSLLDPGTRRDPF